MRLSDHLDKLVFHFLDICLHFLYPGDTQFDAFILLVDSPDIQVEFVSYGVYLIPELRPKLIGFVLEVIKLVRLSLYFLDYELKLLESPFHDVKFPILHLEALQNYALAILEWLEQFAHDLPYSGFEHEPLQLRRFASKDRKDFGVKVHPVRLSFSNLIHLPLFHLFFEILVLLQSCSFGRRGTAALPDAGLLHLARVHILEISHVQLGALRELINIVEIRQFRRILFCHFLPTFRTRIRVLLIEHDLHRLGLLRSARRFLFERAHRRKMR